MTGSTLICIGPDDLDRIWPMVADMLDRAYEATDDVTPDLLPWLKSGGANEPLLWVASANDMILAALTTSLIIRRCGKICRLWSVGGSRIDLWKDHLPEIENYAWSRNCAKVCFDGRGGWARMLTGYRPATIAFEKARPEGL